MFCNDRTDWLDLENSELDRKIWNEKYGWITIPPNNTEKPSKYVCDECYRAFKFIIENILKEKGLE